MQKAREVSIRRARLEDYEQFCRVMDLGDVVHRDGAPWMFKSPDRPPRTHTYFAELLDHEHTAVFVADAGEIAGVVLALLRAAPELPIFHQQRWCVLDGLVVDPAWRRRGIGKLLVGAVEDWAAQSGVPWVELNVYQFNADARRFYEALGYLPYSIKLRKPGPNAD